jgi:hypothetical protein
VSDLKDILGFEGFNLKEMWRKIKQDPERIFIGAGDPASSKMWGKVLGKDYEPVVDQWGGASSDTYDKAEAAGIDTKAGKNMHKIARVISAVYAGGAGANALGGGAGAAGGAGVGGVAEGAAGAASAGGAAGGAGAVGGAAAGGTAGAVTATLPTVVVSGSSAGAAGGLGGLGIAGAAGAGAGVALSSADKAALYGNDGYGQGMSGAETSAYDSALGKGRGFNTSGMGGGEQQREERDIVKPLAVEFDAEGRPMIVSSRTKKTPATSTPTRELVMRGLRGENVIDELGVKVGLIKEAGIELDAIEQQLDQLLQRKGHTA